MEDKSIRRKKGAEVRTLCTPRPCFFFLRLMRPNVHQTLIIYSRLLWRNRVYVWRVSSIGM